MVVYDYLKESILQPRRFFWIKVYFFALNLSKSFFQLKKKFFFANIVEILMF